MGFETYIKAVGTGPKGNRDLTTDEAFDAIQSILHGHVPPEAVGAFLLGLRIKEESEAELLGTKKALAAMLAPLDPIPNSVELSYTFEGKKKHPFLLPLVAKELPHTPLVVSTDSDILSKGTSLIDLQSDQLLPNNVHIYDRSEYILWLSALNSLRQNLSIRTIFNTVEKLLNPVQSPYAIIGAHHTPYFKKYAKLFGDSYERLIVLQGDEGSWELFKKAKLTVFDRGVEVEQFTVDPKDFDIDSKAIEFCSTPKEMHSLLDNPSINLQNLAKLNAKIIQLASKKIDAL